MNEVNRQTNWGLFPRLNDGQEENGDFGVHETSPPSLKLVDDFCRNQGVDIALLFQLAWSIVLRRYAETDCVCIGIGDLSSLDLPVDGFQMRQWLLAPDTSTRALLRDHLHGHVPVPVKDSTTHHNTAVLMMRDQATEDETQWLVGVLDNEKGNYEMLILVDLNACSLPVRLRLLYARRTLNDRQASNVADTMTQTMQQVMEFPDGKIGSLNLFSQGNCQDVVLWNNKQWTKPGMTVVEVIYRIATERPHETAIDSWDNKLSYSQLHELTRRLGHHLRCAGVGPGVMVPIYFPRSAGAIVAELAIMNAGGAFVPIDPSHPPERARSIVDQTKASIGLVAPQFADQMGGLVEHVIVVSPTALSNLPVAEDSITPVPDEMPAYVLFTSGSTGQPKGCVVHHEALANVIVQAGALHLEPGSRALQFASYSFGVSLIEIYCTLVRGATICIPSEEDRLNRLAEVMQEMRITWAYLTTATASSLRPTVDLPDLKTLILTGEPLGNHLIEAWSHKVRLLQGFGFTEWAGVFCVSAPIHSPADKRTIGTSPTANCWLVDVEDHTRLAPIGAVAELAVEGPALAHGYLNNTSKTATSFVERPEWPGIMRPGPESRTYRTGDLVRYQSDGSIQYLTRRDTQVKIRGMRVELGEVEYQIRQAVPQLDRAIVEAAIPLNGQGGPILVAFLYSPDLINSMKQGPADTNEHPLLLTTAPKMFGSWVDVIEQFLRHALPEYMCPMAYCALQSVPMTISGKIDRLSLRALIGTQTRAKLESYRSSPEAKVPPRTEGEKRLHRLFSTVLQIDEESFGVFDRFLRLGGDSLLAIHMVNRAREQHLQGLTVSDILEHQTIANLVIAMNRADSLPMIKARMSPDLEVRPSDLTTTVPNIVEAEDIFPCSAIQEGILLSQIRNGDHYQMRFVWQISAIQPSSSVDIHRLEGAWRRVCARHSMLRTQFYTHASAQHFAIQVVRPEMQNGIAIIHEGPDDPEQLIHSTSAAKDISNGPHLVLLARSSTCVWAVLHISHAMVDAVSTSVIMRDLKWLYDHDSTEQPIMSVNFPSHYRNYVEHLAHLDHENGLRFWKSHLAGIEPCIFPRLQDNTEDTGKQHLQYLSIAFGDLDGHRRFCQQHGVTFATIARLAWALVLRTFTGSDDVCFGFMTAGRDVPLSGIDQSVGPYINMMVSRINFMQTPSLLQVLQEVQSDLTQIWKHQWVPFSRVQHELDLKGDRMFNTSMTFPPHESRAQVESSSITVEEINRTDPTEYDIMIEVGLQEPNIHGMIKYWPSVLSPGQAAGLAQTFSLAFPQIISHPQRSIHEVDLMSVTDIDKVAEWNRQEPEDSDYCVHEKIQDVCRRQPKALAIEAWDGQWTYEELDRVSSNLALKLQAQGVGPEVFLAICMVKSRWTAVAILGAMKAGGAFVLMDPSHPVDRLRHMCTQLHASLVLTLPDQATVAQKLDHDVVVVGEDFLELPNPSTEIVRSEVSSRNALYAVFTSGSTGSPKGVVIEHHSFCASMAATIEASDMKPEDRVFQFASYSFDNSVFDHLVALLAGARLCIASEEQCRNELAASMARFQTTWVIITPSVARLVPPADVPSLRTLCLTGEAVTTSDLQTWAPAVQLLNLYGPAECSIITNTKQCTETTADPTIIGNALRSVATWVVAPDNHDRLVPVGGIGELLVEGAGVGRGYLHHDDPSKPTLPFLTDPQWLSGFRAGTGHRLYKTGDLVQYTSTGQLRYIGRKDAQVKISGQRVELGEIESAIRAFFSGSQEAIVDVVPRPGGKPVLVACLDYYRSSQEENSGGFIAHADSGFVARVAELSSNLNAVLPPFMVPSVFLPLSFVPLAPSGKTDRKSLRRALLELTPDDLENRTNPRTERAPIVTREERQVQVLLSQVFQVPPDRIWGDSHFFQLGGDSLLAMSLVKAARNSGWKVAVEEIFQQPRLSNLARCIRSLHDSNAKSDPIPAFSLLPGDMKDNLQDEVAMLCKLNRDEVEDIYPSTPMQEGLMALSLRETGKYTAQWVYEIPAATDIQQLQDAWQAVVNANAIARTRLVPTEAHGVVQVVVHTHNAQIEWARAANVHSCTRSMQVGQPLLLFSLIYTENGQRPSHMVMTMHHAIYDAVSLSLFLDQVHKTYYGGHLAPRPFNHFVRHHMDRDQERVRQFWAVEFRDLQASVFPPLPVGVTNPTPRSVLKKDVTMARGHDTFEVTMTTILRMAWAIVLSHYTDSSDVVFGVTASGRSSGMDEIDQVMGPTLATFPLRIQLDTKASSQEVMLGIQDHGTRIIPMEQAGLQNIQRASPEAQTACAFQSHLIVQMPAKKDRDETSLLVERNEYLDHSAISTYALGLICDLPSEDNRTASISAIFDPDVLDDGDTGRLLAQFWHVVEQLCTDPRRPVAQIETLSREDLQTLQEWNGKVPAPYAHTIHALVLQQVAKNPHKLAVSSWDGELSYQQLEEASAHLARRLLRLGLQPGTVVPLCFHKGTWPVVAMLAVLRSGGACANIDPKLPAGRATQILKTTQPQMVLTSPERRQFMADALPHQVPIYCIPGIDKEGPATGSPSVELPHAQPSDAAFIVFTSGSTGTPKGIVVEHGNLATCIYHTHRALGMTAETRALQFTAYAFDVSLYDTLAPLVLGATTFIPSEETRLSHLGRYIEDHRIDLAMIIPSAVSVIHPAQVPSLQTLVLLGEPITRDVADTWASQVQLINAYGPAEGSVVCSAGHIIPEEWRLNMVGPMQGTVGWIVHRDDPSQLMPLGAVGELLLEGPMVTRGYLHDPEKTRASYISPPEWLTHFRHGKQSDRLYLTGDLVQLTSHGSIRILGRKDNQVKLHGQRIELEEVESHIRRHWEGAEDVAAEAIQRIQGDHDTTLLVGFVCVNEAQVSLESLSNIIAPPSPSFLSSAAAARRGLQETLPLYMVPAVLLRLSFMPRSKSGKIDRRCLREAGQALAAEKLREYSNSEDAVEHRQGPVTHAEEALQCLWASVLRVSRDDISRSDNFFHLGGESITAMKLVSLAQREGHSLLVAQVFDNPRLCDMASFIHGLQSGRSITTAAAPFSLIGNSIERERVLREVGEIYRLPSEQIEDVYPCTPLQEGLFALTSKDPRRYVETTRYNVPEDVDLDRFFSAWQKFSQAHPILRTRIIQDSGTGQTHQVVTREPIPWEKHSVEDLADLADLELVAGVGAALCRCSLVMAPGSSRPLYFVISMHHSIYDEWSNQVLLTELDQAYRGLSLQHQPFSALVTYQVNSQSAAEDFWTRELALWDQTHFPTLPSASYIPSPNSTSTRTVQLPMVSHSLMTVATEIQCAWGLLVSQYTGSRDVIFGLTSSGRGTPVRGIDRVVGPALATSPRRMRIDLAATVPDALRDIQARSIALMPYEYFGVQNIGRLGDSHAHACEFQSLLVIHSAFMTEASSSVLTEPTLLSNVAQFSNYGLQLVCVISQGQIEVHATFDDQVIHPRQMQRILRQFEHLLIQVHGASRSTTIAQLDTISEDDRLELDQWNSFRVFPDQQSCLHDLVQRRCHLQPTALAVCAWDGDLTYGELGLYSSRLAVYLQSRGVGPESFVPLLFEKSRLTVLCQMAVLKAGGAFVLMDPAHPILQAQRLCEELQSTLVLTSVTLSNIAEKIGREVITFTADLSSFYEAYDGLEIQRQVTTTGAVYAGYTSGSTGRPKIFVLEHHSACQAIQALCSSLPVNSKSRVFQFAGYTFDISIMDHFLTLVAGGCLCVPSESDRCNQLAHAMDRYQVDYACLTTSVLRTLHPRDVPSVKTVVQIGEAMAPDVVDCWSARCHLINAYGPAECALACSVQGRFDPGTEAANIGTCTTGALWVVDRDDYRRLLPIGAVGELVVEGPQVGRGYMGDPEKTAAAFVELPPWLKRFSGRPAQGAQLYRTGDLASIALDGTLRCLGRQDLQVKLRGQRLDLLAVQHHTLHAFPGARDVMADVVACGDGRPPALMAFVASESTNDHQDNEVRFLPLSTDFSAAVQVAQAQLELELPPYAVPSMFVPIAQVPLNENGKANRRHVALAAARLSMEQLRSYQGTKRSMVAPVTATQRQVRDIWARVLRVAPETISIHDNFFQIGGDSITCMQVAALFQSIGIHATAVDIWQYKSVAGLVRHCCQDASEHIDETTWDSLTPIQTFYFERNPSGDDHFNQGFTLQLKAPVSPERIRMAIQRLVETHSMLRARFQQSQSGSWRQRVTEDSENSFGFKEMSVPDEAALSRMLAVSHEPLDIQKGPLFIADLIHREDTGQRYLSLVAHHLVVDLVSWWIIIADLEDLLRGATTLPPTSTPFMVWCSQQACYAKEHLSPQQALPTVSSDGDGWTPEAAAQYWGLPSCSNTVAETVEYDFSLDAKTTAALMELNTPLVSIIHGCLLHAFGQAFEDRPVPTAFVEGHGREPWDQDIDLTRTVGWFTTLWPAHVSIQQDQLVGEVIRKTHEIRSQVPHNGWVYFASRYLNPKGRLAFDDAGPLECTFNYGGVIQPASESNAILELDSVGMKSRRQARNEMVRLALLEVNSLVFDGSLQVKFGVNRNMKKQDALQRWVRECERSLKEVASQAYLIEASHSLSGHPLVNLATKSLAGVAQDMHMSIEDVYPCTPLQRGILLSQLRNPRLYNTLWTVEVRQAHGHPAVDLQRLQRAWTKVVSRHAALRTILVSFPGTDFAHQLVLKDFEPVIPIITNAVHDAASQVQEMTDQREPNSWTPTPQAAIIVQGDNHIQIGLSINHVFVDASSVQLLVRDLRMAYDGQLSLKGPARFKDFVDHVQRAPSSAALLYWTDYLHELQFCHLLPSVQAESHVGHKTNHENPSVGSVSIELIDSTTLQSFCSEHGLLVTNILHVAWALVLQCYTSMDDVCFSFVTSSRDTAVLGIEDCIGPMINHLVARLSIQPNTTVLQLLESNQRVLFNHLGHQSCSLSDVVHLTHSAGRPAFDTSISVRRDLPARVLPNASTSLQVVDSRIQTEYPFLVDVCLAADQARASLVYWQSLLPQNKATMIAYTFRQVVKEMLRNPVQTIRELDVVPPESKCQIARWNQAPILETWELVPAEIMRRTMEAPDAPAVCAWDGSMTYRELDYRSSFLSAYLVEQGAGREVFIPVCLEKSIWVPVAVCAILKAGAAFCLLDVSFPPQRLQVMCEQLDAKLALTSARSLDLARHLGTPIIVSTHSGPEDLHNTQVPEYNLVGSPRDAAYAVFTSGSTGKPKAAVIDHQASCASIRGQVLGAGRDSTSRVYQFSSHAFDVASNDYVASLMTGACLCIPSEEDRISKMAETARIFEATWMTTTPSVARLFSPEDVPTMETVVVGGETPTEADINQWGSRYVVVYGPAECCAIDTIRHPVNLDDGTASIGHALPSARTWIVDQHDSNRLMPVGAVGEFVLEGTSIGRGYHQDPEKTQQIFIDPPAWRHRLNLPGKVHRFYRTGDLASYLPDGSLRFQGRRDFQVKVRGQRLELADVEHHMIKAFPRASQVVADLIKPATGSQKPTLMAFIGQEDCQSLPSSSPALSDNLFMQPNAAFHEAVRSALPLLRDWLPSFMVPEVFMQLAAIPMTAGGKVDRRSIRTQATQLENTETASYSTAVLGKRSPSNAAEVQLHALVSSVLKLPSDLLGVDDHLLQRGLDSIQAMKLVSMAKQRGIALTVPDIFAHPQISALAAVTETVTEKYSDTNDSPALPRLLVGTTDYEHLVTEIMADQPFDCVDVERVLPTTSFQREYLAAMYAAYFVFRLPCALDSARLTMAVQSVVQKYSILRTAFVPFQDTIMQVVLRNAGEQMVELPLDVSDFPAAVWKACQDDCLHPHSSKDLYFQATLARGPSGQSALVLRLNHAQFDRLSISALFMDFSAAYSSSLSLRLAPSFGDALAHRSQLHTPSAFHFWEELLKGSCMTELGSRSSDNPGPATRIERQRIISLSPAPSQFTIATMHKAAWALTLSRETKSRDLVFGQVASGRNTSQFGIEDALGPCANVVPVRVALQPRWTVEDLLQHVQSQHVRSMEFETVDFEEIVKLSTPWPQGSSLGSVIQYQNIPLQPEIQFGDVTATYDTYQFNVPCREPHLTSRFTDDNTLCLFFSVSECQLDANHADRLLAVFGDILGLLAADMKELVDKLL